MVVELILSSACGFAAGYVASALHGLSQYRLSRSVALRLSDVEERQLKEAKRYANLVGLNKQDRDRSLIEGAAETLAASREKRSSAGYDPADPFLDKVWGK